MPILNSAYFTECRRHIVIPCGKVCRIKNRHTFRILPILNSAYFKSMPILNSSYHAVKYAELRIGSILKVCRFVIRHITQTETQTETEANFTHHNYWVAVGSSWVPVKSLLFTVQGVKFQRADLQHQTGWFPLDSLTKLFSNHLKRVANSDFLKRVPEPLHICQCIGEPTTLQIVSVTDAEIRVGRETCNLPPFEVIFASICSYRTPTNLTPNQI